MGPHMQGEGQAMKLPRNKTKIVCTIGPASEPPEVIERMILAGMSVARLNLSHGDPAGHRQVVQTLRRASRATGRRLAIMADLPGPKMRVGRLAGEPLELRAGDTFTLTTREVIGGENKVAWVSFSRLPQVVKPGDTLFLNDGLIQLEAVRVEVEDVQCRVVVGGELWSGKGLNLPGIDLGISAFTSRDHQCLKLAMDLGVDAVGQSFVESAKDICSLRSAAREMGWNPFVFAKIERATALDQLDSILDAADGIMIARGDLGVEIPIEEMAIIQKRLIHQANLLGKPVITATQMLESMTSNRRPTRAEATDVANAILDGTDCVMLSAESAVGRYPVEATSMLARIAAAVEPHRRGGVVRDAIAGKGGETSTWIKDLIAVSVQAVIERICPTAVFVPTHSGATARNIARFRPPVWIVGISSLEETCQRLEFTSGVYPVHEPVHPRDWNTYVRNWLQSHGLEGDLVILTEGPSSQHPEANDRVEIIDLAAPFRPSSSP